MLNILSTTTDIESALQEVEWELGDIEKVFEKKTYTNKFGETFYMSTIANTGYRYAYVIVRASGAYCNNLSPFGGAIRHYLHNSSNFGGPKRGRKVVQEKMGFPTEVHYIIDNPYYTV